MNLTKRASVVGLELDGKCLIATPEISPNSIFARSLIYLVNQDAGGNVLGVVVNKPADAHVDALLDSLNLEDQSAERKLATAPIYIGGPVATSQVNIVHEKHADWLSDFSSKDSIIAITGRKDMLAAICTGAGPAKYLIVAGIAGWSPGQLEAEIGNNSWLVTEADPDIIFNTPPELRASMAAEQLGIELNFLGSYAGSG